MTSSKQSLSLPQDEGKLMTRQDVQEYLNISETTYKLQVKMGLLKPMIMPGGHRYRKCDLDKARAESVRRDEDFNYPLTDIRVDS